MRTRALVSPGIIITINEEDSQPALLPEVGRGRKEFGGWSNING